MGHKKRDGHAWNKAEEPGSPCWAPQDLGLCRSKIFTMIFPVFLVSFLLIAQNNALTGRGRDKDSPFRMNKLNIVWQKAQKKMSVQKLADLRRLLELQDRAEIKWKDVKAYGGDEDGEMEATLRRKFYRILEQFGLEKHFDGVDEGNEIRDNKASRGVFGDKRLSELWESAKKHGG